jgi:hypothetical protein
MNLTMPRSSRFSKQTLLEAFESKVFPVFAKSFPECGSGARKRGGSASSRLLGTDSRFKRSLSLSMLVGLLVVVIKKDQSQRAVLLGLAGAFHGLAFCIQLFQFPEEPVELGRCGL